MNKHTLSTLLFMYVATLFVVFINNFANSNDDSIIAIFVFMILLVVSYYMYDYETKNIPHKILLTSTHFVASLVILILSSFDVKTLLFAISTIGLEIFFILFI